MPPQDGPAGTVPNCPRCGAAMRLRRAQQGHNAGNRFWGCSRYPRCTGTRTLENANEPETPAAQGHGTLNSQSHGNESLPVQWLDHAQRRGWIAEYVNIAAVPGFFRNLTGTDTSTTRRALGQTIMLRRDPRDRAPTTDMSFASGILSKILQRGELPTVTLETERQLLDKHGLLEKAEEQKRGQLGWELPSELTETISSESIIAATTSRASFTLVDQLTTPLLDSPREEKFLVEWVPQAFGNSAGHWFIPQAPLDQLLASFSSNHPEAANRRVDFLFAHPNPNVNPFVIELDGPEHATAAQVDDDRDAALETSGLEVIRIPNHELDSGDGPNLDEIRKRCADAFQEQTSPTSRQPVVNAIIEASLLAKVQFAIIKAMEWGWLVPDGRWTIQVEGVDQTCITAIRELIDLVVGINQLYDLKAAPSEVVVEVNGTKTQWSINSSESGAHEESRLTIRLEADESPFAAIHHRGGVDIVIRPAFTPVQFLSQTMALGGRRKVQITDEETATNVLHQYLKQIFRKADFRSKQSEAILRTLQNRDSIVLLPTGAGKSIIYQLAGLLMPGVTLVVDPIIALIDDQQEGLAEYGIDRTVAITGSVQGTLRDRLHQQIERAEPLFIFVAPERLQIPTFRAALRSLNESSCINLAVVDEAHCVSEWGHDFRPAYLNLANNLRKFGTRENEDPIPILALTGTAARAVLRDMITDMEIDREDPYAIIRPSSFDRKELRYEIKTTRPGDSTPVLRGILNTLPTRFNLPRAEFFALRDKNTQSGILFVPTVDGRINGVRTAQQEVRNAVDVNAVIYSRKPPRGENPAEWDRKVKQNGTNFKTNRCPILVATKAFGMGIDKPNIRYTIHFGMPQSLEAFYQEAGRAGRDGNESWCFIVFTEHDSQRSDRLLDASRSIDSLRQEHQRIRVNTRDDITSALWFHLGNFGGLDAEKEHVRRVISELGEFEEDLRSIEISFTSPNLSRKQKERALHRLVKIGSVIDYEVNYGGQRITVHMDRYNPERWKQCSVSYVRAAQPARAEQYAEQVRHLSFENQDNTAIAAIQLAETLVDFTYNVIEKSRRRMIQEAMLIARDVENEKDFRQRLLDYLQEGVGNERMQQLAEEEAVGFNDWIELAQNINTPIEAGEFRGLSIRLLESYPDHPGLLVVRALSEAFTNEPNRELIRQSLDAALGASIGTDYNVEEQEILILLNYLFEVAQIRTSALAPPLADVVLDGRLDDEEWSFMQETVLIRAKVINHPHMQTACAVQQLSTLASSLEEVVSMTAGLAASPQLEEAMENVR